MGILMNRNDEMSYYVESLLKPLPQRVHNPKLERLYEQMLAALSGLREDLAKSATENERLARENAKLQRKTLYWTIGVGLAGIVVGALGTALALVF